MTGRGAWTTTGHSNGTRYYQYNGTTDGKGTDESSVAVHLGVKALQGQLGVTADGFFGPQTATAAKAAQTRLGLTADGIVGQKTCERLWRNLIAEASSPYGTPPDILYGQVAHESSFDPGAVGYFHTPDRGLVQINTEATGVTIELAHDPAYALNYSAKRFAAALKKYGGKGEQLAIICAIAAHNSPSGADTWYRTEKPGNNAISDYVSSVLSASQGW